MIQDICQRSGQLGVIVMIDILFNVWNAQKVHGYVSMSERNTNLSSTEDGYWKDRSWKWPQDKAKVQEWYNEHSQKEGYDIYWSPAVYSKPGRHQQDVISHNVLYADLDPVDPRTLATKPSIAWESSPGRYQAVWIHSNDLSVEDWLARNRNLSYAVGADKSGWDLTQVLRVPGGKNHKYKPVVKGKLLWQKWENITSIPESEVEVVVDEVSTHENLLLRLLTKYKREIPAKVSRMLQYPPSRIEPGHRSDMLWYLESELVKSQIPLEDIVVLIRDSAWNKYRGRSDEQERIYTEVSKVYQQSIQGTLRVSEPVDDVLASYEDIMGSLVDRPGWLIRDIWMRNSHGIVAGEPKTYKSTITTDIAVSVASGAKLWDKYEVDDPGPVLIIQNENAPWIVKSRLESIIESKGLVGNVVRNGRILTITWPPVLPIYHINNSGFSLDSSEDCDMLMSYIEKIRPKLLILDPLYLMFNGDINSAKELSPVLQFLLSVRDTYGCSIMVIHHWNKNGSSSRGGQRMLGSATLHGWTDSSLFLSRDEGDVVIEREFRSAGPGGKLVLQIDSDEVRYRVRVGEKDAQGENSNGVVLDYLSMYPGGQRMADIVRGTGLSKYEVSKVLMSDSRVKKKGALYSL